VTAYLVLLVRAQALRVAGSGQATTRLAFGVLCHKNVAGRALAYRLEIFLTLSLGLALGSLARHGHYLHLVGH